MPQHTGFTVYFLFLFFSILTGLFVYLAGFILKRKTKNNPQNPDGNKDLEDLENSNTQYKISFLNFWIFFFLLEASCAVMFPFAYIKGVLDEFYCMEIMIFILILILILLFSIKSRLLKIYKDWQTRINERNNKLYWWYFKFRKGKWLANIAFRYVMLFCWAYSSGF